MPFCLGFYSLFAFQDTSLLFLLKLLVIKLGYLQNNMVVRLGW